VISPTVVIVPSTWSSPVVVPLTLVSSLPSTEIVTVPSQSSVVVVDWTNVPTNVPSTLVYVAPT
jgi:hypothetical protein